jgi:hypothetical protein
LAATAGALSEVPVLKPFCHECDSDNPQNDHKITRPGCTAPFQKLQPKVTPLFFLCFFLFKEKSVSLFSLLCRGPLRTLEAEVLLILDALIIALQKPSRKASEKAKSPSKAQQAELMPAVNNNVVDPTSVRERAGLQTGAEKSGGLTDKNGGLTNGRGEADQPGVDATSNLGQATSLMDTHVDQGSTAKQELNGQREEVPDRSRDKVSKTSLEHLPADPLSSPAEVLTADGRSPGKGIHEKHHKHRFFSRHQVSKKVEPLPFDQEVFQHPIPVTDDDVSRLGAGGAVSVQTVLREFEHR